MENIGQVTVDLSGSLAFTKDLCDRLGLVPGEKLIVARGHNGEVSLKPLEKMDSDEITQRLNAIYEKQDSSLATALVQMQTTALEVADEGEMKLVNKHGVLVFTLENTEALPGLALEWLNDPVNYDRELRLRELMRGSGLESVD